MPDKRWTGLGNINLFSRPYSKNPNGSSSSLYSTSFNRGGQEILVPGVDRTGKGILSEEDAEKQYDRTGEFLGKFLSVPETNTYGEQLHKDAEAGLTKPPLATSRSSVDPNQLEKVLMFLLMNRR